MGYQRRYLQRVGLMSTLLIGGVLGGLIAPFPSEAVPTLTLTIDDQPVLQKTTDGVTFTNVTGNSILGSPVACTSADTGLGYTACYSILTSTTVAYKASNNRLYRIQNAPSATARLRVGDNLGPDFLSLIGVQVVPVNTPNQRAVVSTDLVNTLTDWGSRDANTNETHTLTLTLQNLFDSTVNVNNATNVTPNGSTVPNGPQVMALRAGGEFRSARLSTPIATTTLFCGTTTTPARCNTVGNKVEYTGQGIFTVKADGTPGLPVNILNVSPEVTNLTPLSLTVGQGSKDTSIVTFDGLSNATMGQIDPKYPRFSCNTGNNACKETITQTMKVTLKGPDTFVLVNGEDLFLDNCADASSTRLTKLVKFLQSILNFLIWIESQHQSDPLEAIIAKIQLFLTTYNAPTDPTCPGATVVRAMALIASLTDQVAFAASGGVPADVETTGTLTIIKETEWYFDQGPEAPPFPNGTFDFSIWPLNCFECSPIASPQIAITDGSGTGTVSISVPPGDYNLDEDNANPGGLGEGGLWYNSITCVPGDGNSFTVTAGSNVVCTVHNTNQSD